jgi:hypothetical protein
MNPVLRWTGRRLVKPTVAKDFDYHQIVWAQENPV